MNNIAIIILAAGKGERMKSSLPKVLHPICGRPMVNYVLDLAASLKGKKEIVVVLGHEHQQVKKALPAGIKTVTQKKIIGTADAIKQAMTVLKGFKGAVLVLYADIPLLKKEAIQKLLDHHHNNKPDLTLLTATVNKPEGYGRILRDKYNTVYSIVEEKDADDFQKSVKEINTGIMCFSKDKLAAALAKIRPNNRKKEYYLTDAVNILYKKGCLIESVKIKDYQEALGVNSRAELALANSIMQGRINDELMKNGVSIVAPASTFISYGVKIGKDTVIYPFTVIEKDVKIGRRCFVGPFAHLREGTALEDDITAGNFLEIIRSKISSNTFAKHFGYIGDSRVGRAVNIGAGTVTANFDGQNKNITVIKDKAFIGSDSVLVAPVIIGKEAVVGAGSVVTRNTKVADRAVMVGVPARQLKTTVKNKEGR